MEIQNVNDPDATSFIPMQIEKGIIKQLSEEKIGFNEPSRDFN